MSFFSKNWVLVFMLFFFGGVLLHTQAQQTSQGELKLEITAGQSCCVYGTSVVFGEKDVNFGIMEFTGDFLSYHGTTSRGCKDLLGTETGRAMYIAMSGDMENQNGNKISSGNVKISFNETQLVAGNCIPYTTSGVDVPLNNPVTLVEKDGDISTNYGKICELGTTNVQLKVVTNTGQAPGNYVGTLVIDLPPFANASCDDLIGTFYDAETDGLAYEGDQGSVGVTSNGGQFSYKPGEQITFKVGTVTLGNPVIPATNGSVFVTDLFGLSRTEITDTNVIKVGKLLQGLDDDNNPNNGISISGAIAIAFTENNNITALDIDAKLTALSKPIRTNIQIVQHLENTAETKLGETLDIAYPEISTGVSDSQLMLTGSLSYDGPKPIAKDNLGNIYIVGSFEEPAVFGSTTLTNSGSNDVYVAKINSSGNYERAIKGGGTSSDVGNGITIDGSGNIYVVGNFRGTAKFGSTTLVSSGNYDVFIAKIDPNGNWLRAIKGGGSLDDYGNGIATDGSGNIYVVGRSYGTIRFGSITLANSGSSDVFVVKTDSDGNYQQAIRGGSVNYDEGNGIAIDGMGNIYIVGIFYYDTILGSTTLVSRRYKDNYLAKLNSDLQRVSVEVIEGIEIMSIFSDEQDSLYIGGIYGWGGIPIYIGSNLIYPYGGEEKPNTILYKMVPRDEPETILYETLPQAPQM